MGKPASINLLPSASDAEISDATRRLLFRRGLQARGSQGEGGVLAGIPGAGTSAAKHRERHTRLKITINLDGDLIEFFKERGDQEGVGYQFLINQALREYVDGSRPERMARQIGEILLNDPAFLEAISQKLVSHE